MLIWTVLLAGVPAPVPAGVHRGATWRLRTQENLGEDVSQEVEELEQLESKTLKAIRFSVVAGVVVGLYVVWKSVGLAFAGLDQVVVWSGGDDLMPSADIASTDSGSSSPWATSSAASWRRSCRGTPRPTCPR